MYYRCCLYCSRGIPFPSRKLHQFDVLIIILLGLVARCKLCFYNVSVDWNFPDYLNFLTLLSPLRFSELTVIWHIQLFASVVLLHLLFKNKAKLIFDNAFPQSTMENQQFLQKEKRGKSFQFSAVLAGIISFAILLQKGFISRKVC